MDTSSFQFVLFGLAAAVLSNISRKPLWRSLVLMTASLAFLAMLAHDPIVLPPMIGFLLLGYGGLLLIERGWTRSVVWSILAVIVAYAWLKKYTFLPEGAFLHFPYFTLGLSYIFFRVLHLLIDSGDGDGERHVGIGSYLLYTLNFTTLVSGPIQRYEDFARDQFASSPVPLGPRMIGIQLERIVRGIFKANVLAMFLHALQEDALAQMLAPSQLSVRFLAAFRLAVLYPFFLYCNFSGYIDIVVGLARLMRIRLPENFDRPFSASSFLDFWNRWHITLSSWLKTYVYNPLLITLMRRVSSGALEPLIGVLCFFVTFFLIGIWHGRTSEFVIYGVLLGGGAAINKLWQLGLARVVGRKSYKALAKSSIYIAFGRGLTFSWFAFSLFWFWGNWNQIGKLFTAISASQWLGVWLSIWLSATIVLGIWEWSRAALLSITFSGEPVATHRYARVCFATAMCFTAVLFAVLLNQPAPDIVYKAF